MIFSHDIGKKDNNYFYRTQFNDLFKKLVRNLII